MPDQPPDTQTVFAIGRHGRGPMQFAGDWPADQEPLRRYDTGSDRPDSNWPAFHPGPLDAHHGWQGHRIEVDFQVERPAEAFELRLTFFAGHGPCPQIEIAVGGHTGIFHPVVVRDDRSEVFRQSPIAGSVDLRVPLPGDWLPPGAHRLSVATVIDAPGHPDRYAGHPGEDIGHGHPVYGSWFGSGLSWDGVSLTGAPGQALPTTLRCTPRFVGGGTALRQVLALSTALPAGAAQDAEAVVTLGGTVHRVPLPARGCDFGQVEVEFCVPELAGPADAEVRVGDGVTRHWLVPGRKWTVHLVPHIHLDIGFTDYQGKVLELHSRNLDRAVAVLRRDPGFRFTVDGSVVVQQHLATRQGSGAAPVLDALRDGSLAVNAFHSLFLSGVASLEECFRAAYFSASLRAEHGVDVRTAHLTDVPSYTAAMPSLLAALGIDGFAGIANHARGANSDSDTAHLLSPVMWEGVDGERVLTHFSDSYSQLRFMASDPQTMAGAEQAFDRFVSRYERDDYLPQDLPVIGSHADNEDLGDGDADFVRRWNEVHAYPRMVLSTLSSYLDRVRPLSDRLPVWRGDGGSYWEDGVGTAARIEAVYRRAQMLVPVAENLAALTSRAGGAYRPKRDELDGAWEALLAGCEHTWTWSHMSAHPDADEGHDHLDWKRHQIHSAWRTGTDETRRALSQLGELVTTDGPTLLVYNPLNWQRSADVEVEIERADRLLLDGRPVPTEVVHDMGGLRRVRLTVPGLPAFGYRALRIATDHEVQPAGPGGRDAGGSGSDDGPGAGGMQVDSPRWQVALDAQGMVTGLLHRPSGRQLIDQAAGRQLGAVLYAALPDPPPPGDHDDLSPWMTSLSDRRPQARPFAPEVTAAVMRPAGVTRTYDGWRLRARGSGPTLPSVEVEVLLRDDSDTVDVRVRLDKDYRLAKESVYVAFPFAVEDPVIRYDRQLGWIDPARDHSPGACHEWFTTQHGVVVSSGEQGPAVAWTSQDAPLFTVGDVVRATWPDAFDAGDGRLLSWVMNNHWPTNTPPAQRGPLDLRYSFTPLPAFDPERASRLGRELRVPAVAGDVTWLDKADTDPRPLPADRGALLDLGAADGVHISVAESREPGGLVLRVQDLTGAARAVRLRHPSGAGGRVRLAYADERPRDGLPVDAEGHFTIELKGYSVTTVLVDR
ncbi:hypothetical protein [Streptomyces sp. CA-111067]|uniref:glycoside hydrolase family 38 N-terminal domain-containing protein n=1 Tax=Streptomyces sp. CA-111067 TaxID=3240046 RepID=UPI003D978B44